MTFFDALLKELRSGEASIALRSYLLEHEYDSDAIRQDMGSPQSSNGGTSNIESEVNDRSVVDEIRTFMLYHRRMFVPYTGLLV